MSALGVVRSGAARARSAVGRWSDLRFALTAGALVAVVVLVRLLVPSTIGLADHGDGQRLLCQIGLRADQEQTQAPEDFVVTRWRDHRFYGETCGPATAGGTIHTSQRALLIGARMLSPIFGVADGIDLRAMAVAAAMLLGCLAAALVLVTPGGREVGLLVAAAILASVVDRGVAGVFVSAHTDAAALIGLLACVVFALAVLRSAPVDAGPLVALAAAGGFTVLSMPQMVSMAPLIAVALVWRPSRIGTVGQSSMLQRLRRRSLGAVLAVAILALGIWSLGAQPTAAGDAHRHDQVFGTILVRSGSPDRDLAWLGLDQGLASLTGSSSDARNDLLESEAYRSFDEQVRWWDIAWFYALHPVRLADLGVVGIDSAATYRDHQLASYPTHAGVGPRRTESRVWTTSFFFAAADAVPALLVLVLAGALVAAAVVLKRRRSGGATALALVAVGLGLGAITSFWMVLIGVGQVHLVRHLLVFDVMVVWSAVLAAAAIVVARRPGAEPAHQSVLVAEEPGRHAGSPGAGRRPVPRVEDPTPATTQAWFGEMWYRSTPEPATSVSAASIGPELHEFDEELMRDFLAGAAAANASDPYCWSWLYDVEDGPAPGSARADAHIQAALAEVRDLGPDPVPAAPTSDLDHLLATSDLDYLEVLRSRSCLAPSESPSPRRPS